MGAFKDYMNEMLGDRAAEEERMRRDYNRQFWGPPFHVSTPEERAWNDAIRWLEAREAERAAVRAADEEWPWPRRKDFNYEGQLLR